MLRAFLRHSAQLWRSNPCIWPQEDFGVGFSGASRVVFTRDIKGEVEDGLATGFEEGGESAIV